MGKKGFEDLAKEAMDFTKEGLDRLIKVDELLEALKSMPKNKDFQQLTGEIIEEEKIAVGLIQRATLIERELMKKQQEAIKRLISTL